MRLLFLIALTSMAPVALAQTEPEPQFSVYGAGTMACTQVTAAAEDPAADALVESWVLGYITAVSIEYAFDDSAKVRLRESDRDSMMLWIEDYCLEHPEKDLTDAGFYLAVALLEAK